MFYNAWQCQIAEVSVISEFLKRSNFQNSDQGDYGNEKTYIYSNTAEELFAKDCKLINLKYEYTGYIGQEKWAIVSELSEQELFEKYPDEVKKYIPFVLLSVEQGKAIQAYNRNEDKYRKRQNNNSDAFGYDDGTTENMHSKVSVPDFIEQQEMDDYYNRRAEEKMRLFVTAMASLTEKQHKYLVMRYVDGISARDIAKAEGVAHQVVDRHILAAKKKIEKIFGDFFRK